MQREDATLSRERRHGRNDGGREAVAASEVDSSAAIVGCESSLRADGEQQRRGACVATPGRIPGSHREIKGRTTTLHINE